MFISFIFNKVFYSKIIFTVIKIPHFFCIRPTGISNRHFATKIEPPKVDTPVTNTLETSTMDYSKMTVKELIALCKEKGVKGYSGKKKAELVNMLSSTTPTTTPGSVPKIEAGPDALLVCPCM
jgi:hypothetical protein